MDLDQIKIDLASAELQMQLQALTALRAYEITTAVPLLCSRLDDPNPLVRASVAGGLGLKRSPQSYQALQTLLQDAEPTVRAEAVVALGKFSQFRLGRQQICPIPALLIQTFERDTHALVRAAVLEAIAALPAPLQLFKLCTAALEDCDVALQEQATYLFSRFAETDMHLSALDHLQPLVRSPHGSIRAALARSLQAFDNHRARETLTELHNDKDHRVVAALLEQLV